MIDSEVAKQLLSGYTLVGFNDEVEIKLSDYGRDIYFHKDDELNEKISKTIGEGVDVKYFTQQKPVEVDGWFKEQLWVVMSIFGKHMIMGHEPVFTEIRIKNGKD